MQMGGGEYYDFPSVYFLSDFLKNFVGDPSLYDKISGNENFFA